MRGGRGPSERGGGTLWHRYGVLCNMLLPLLLLVSHTTLLLLPPLLALALGPIPPAPPTVHLRHRSSLPLAYCV